MFQFRQLFKPLTHARTFVGFNERTMLITDEREVGSGVSLEILNLECHRDWQNPDKWTDKRVQETYAYLLTVGDKLDAINNKLDRLLDNNDISSQ